MIIFSPLILIFGLLSVQGNVISPIILIPGLSGSQLEAKLDKLTVDHIYCTKVSEWFTIWINLEELVPYVVNCFTENVALDYNVSSGIFTNISHVEIRAPGFGNTTTIEYLDPDELDVTKYMYGLVEPLSKMGYTRGVNIHGAPYDWRLAPDTLIRVGYYQNLRNLVKESFVKNFNTPVTLVCHSLGCPTILYFLNSQITKEWKSKYIHHLVTLSGAWAGTVSAIEPLISGSNSMTPFAKPLNLRKTQRTIESTYFLLPSEEVFDTNKTIVSVGSLNYSLANIDQLFLRLNLTNAIAIRKQTMIINQGFIDPQVPILCIHGSSLPTTETFEYAEEGFPDKEPKSIYGDGDGTVDLVSLETCLKWKDSPGFQYLVIEGKEGEHVAIIWSKQVVNAILKVTQL